MNKHFPFKKVLTSLGLTIFLFFTLKAQIPAPTEHFGFTPGDDRMLFLYEDMMDYMKKLEEASPMVHIEEIGKTEMGRPMYIVFVSSEENIRNLESLRQINRQLALDEIPAGTNREELFEKGKVFFLSTLSMHASEVGPAQAFPLVVHELIAGTDPRRESILENTVAMFILPQKQHDLSEMVDLVNLLHRHGVNTYRLREDVVWNDRNFKTGDLIIPLAQPYRAFIKEVLEFTNCKPAA